MFLLVSVILFTGGGLPQCMLGYHPPPRGRRYSLGSMNPPGKHAPPGRRHPPKHASPGKQTPPRHTVNERPVRILLEFILVSFFFLAKKILFTTTTHQRHITPNGFTYPFQKARPHAVVPGGTTATTSSITLAHSLQRVRFKTSSWI